MVQEELVGVGVEGKRMMMSEEGHGNEKDNVSALS